MNSFGNHVGRIWVNETYLYSGMLLSHGVLYDFSDFEISDNWKIEIALC